MPRTRLLSGAIAATLLFSAAASASQFDKVVIIGDSLSDAGNLSLALNPQIQPPLRFTTNPGETASELVADHLGLSVKPSLLGGTDFAFGGAGLNNNSSAGPIPTLPQQLQLYLASNGGVADPHALYQVWGGANDIFYQTAVSTDPTVLGNATIAAAQTELGLLTQLQTSGARYVVVYNLPDIGKTPSSQALGPAAAAGASQLSVAFNSQLNAGLGQLSAKGLNIIPVNTYALINEVIADPAAFGFTNVTVPACGLTASSVVCGPQGSGLPYTYAPGTDQTYLFADGVHPTTAAHRLLSEVVLSELAAPGQASLLGEAALTSVLTQTHAVRNEMQADDTGSGSRVFAKVGFAQQRFDSSVNTSEANSNNINLTLGADLRQSDSLSFGGAVGISNSNAGFVGGTGGYKLQDVSVLGYLTYHVGSGYFGGYADLGKAHFTNVQRIIQIGPDRRVESSNTGGTHGGVGLTGGWWFGQGTLKNGPFVNVEWQDASVSSFQESSNDSTSMAFGSQQRLALISTLGWKVQGQWQTSYATLKPYGELSWNHDNKANVRNVSAGLTTLNGSFAMPGFIPDKNWGSVELGMAAQFSPNLSGSLSYDGRFSDSSQKYNSLNLGLKYSF